MAAYDTHVLATWSAIIYSYGHWAYTEEGQSIQKSGAYWKIAHAFAQCVRERLKKNLPAAFAEVSHKPYLGVQDGMLHLYYSTRDMWLNREIGVASEKNTALAYALILGMGEPSEKDVARLRRKMDNGQLKGWVDLTRFMVEEKPNGIPI